MPINWNNTATPYQRDACIHKVFEEQAERTPEATALLFGETRVSYAELNRRANRLAHHLRGLGVGPEVLVGLCVERSIEMVVALLGILKAGGAYVPLDPSYPLERLSVMIEEVGLKTVLTQRHLTGTLPAGAAKLIPLDDDGDAIGREPETNPDGDVAAENLAYVIFTSGSTGRPKGVGVPHRAVLRLVKGNHYADLSAEQTFLLLAPISFDASTFEVWGSLLNGARLALAPPGAPSLKELGETLRRYDVSTLWLTAGRALAATRREVRARGTGLHVNQRLRADGEHDLHLLPHG
jgi:non-ribosomal peptide synthetase component F